jgi:hypothetical protein
MSKDDQLAKESDKANKLAKGKQPVRTKAPDRVRGNKRQGTLPLERGEFFV